MKGTPVTESLNLARMPMVDDPHPAREPAIAATPHADAGPASGTTDALDDLRTALNKRLRADRRRLVTLRAMILHHQDVAPSIFEELHFLAHRMCGSAAIFGIPALASGAQAVLDELVERQMRNAEGSDRTPLLTLDALIDSLFRADDRTRKHSRKKRA